MEELLHWLEVRISSSLRPRPDDIKTLLMDHTYRTCLSEFLKNEDVHTLYVYFKLSKASLAASLCPPPALQSKCTCFIKLGTAPKLTLENIANNVISVDCAQFPLKYFDMVLHQIYLPLLCNDNVMGGRTPNTDKIIDILHRFTGNLEIIAGHAEGSIVLPIPSLELLRNPSLFNKHGATIHVMETTVIGWIRQIKLVLKHDPLVEIKTQGLKAGIYHEEDMWKLHIHNLQSISRQLSSVEAREIVSHLEQAKSMYGHSIAAVTEDVKKALSEAAQNLTFLKPLLQWFDQLKSAMSAAEKQKTFFPMLHSLFLVWIHSRYYHQNKVFINLLRLMSNETVKIARDLLGTDVLHSPQAYSFLKEALKICATFRGNYLDIKDKADKINSEKNEENANQMLKKSKDIIWNTPLYRQLAPKLIGLPSTKEKKQVDEQPLWVDSPWPPHNSACFQNMNMFMERCNNALDLVETMRHFQVLKSVAAVGGAGTSTLDAMVQDIWDLYCTAKETFDHQIKDIFSTDRNSAFEKAFFDFRTTIKNLEHQLGDILRCSFEQCPNITSQLRLLEVFEGISRRDVVKDHLKDKDQQLVSMFMEELTQVNDMYLALESSPPLHINMTPTVSNLLWVKALKARISDPMTKLRTVSPLTLEGDTGWKLRHMYTDTAEQLERFETNLITSWLSAASKQLGDSLKLPLLRAAGLRHGQEEFPYKIELNLNPDFLVYLREAQYLLKPPFKVKLPESIEPLVSNLDMNKFKILSTRLEMVASKYNDVMKTISYHQRPLFEKKLLKSYEILKDGMHFFTWSMDESTDYTELAISCICTDLHINFSIVTNNYKIITELTTAWCTANLDIFTCRDFSRSYSITELMTEQKIMEQELRSLLIPDGQRIHCLVQQSFIACGISEASPPWQDYIMHIDALVLQGLKKVTITTLASMLNSLLDCDNVPILSVDVQLINSEAAFNPPLDRSTSDRSVIEIVEEWLEIFLLRGSCVKGLSSFAKGGYQEYLSEDDEALQLIGHILQQMEKSMLDCQALLEVFKNYTSVWKQDINVEFQNFLHGKQSVKPSVVEEGSVYEVDPVTQSSNGSTTRSENVSVIEAERSFILPKDLVDDPSNRPLLQDFDSEISAYKTARDSIQRMPDLQRCGWIQVDFRPVKQVLSAYALRWMWIFTNYLTDLTTSNLKSLDSFLKRTEPQIESITGEERDTGSFMKMMRLFNEVSAKQVEMDVQFAVLQRTVTLLGKHDTQLPTESEVLFRTMPARWNSMKTKVSLAKQRLGPRIQQEADRVIRDLERFQHKLDALGPDIENSEVYRYTCAAQEAFMVIQNFSTRLQSLQKEAKDLKELQELLETTVVDFSILINCEDLLQNLHLMWQHVDLIHKEQDTWKKELWQNLDTEELYKRTSQQLRLLQSLPGEVQEWDVYKQTAEAVNIMHFTLPLIEDLSNPAMRTRHWNQLVRQTGGMLRVTAESLKAMTLGDLLAMDLQKHTGEVRSTVQRAIRDVTIESSLKNCEEVWLSRIFELRPHSRIITSRAHNEEIASSVSGSHYTKGEVGRNTTTRSSRRMSRQSDKGFYLSKKGGRGSTMSLYESLKNIEELGTVMLLRSTDSIFEELEHHQLLLTTMQPYAEAGSFLDELIKWRKKLQVIETTVQLWLLVQEKWTQLEEVFSTLAFCVAMPREAVLFADAHHHFCRLMKSVEDNPNILQNCMRRGLQSLLEVMNYKLERCQRAVRHHLEQRRLAFPRFFFLSLEDTFNIVCYGYDLSILSGFVVKIFQHVHSLIYDISESNSETGCHNILGVRSFLKEELYLTQPLECRGPVESWLPQLVSSIQSSLQHHLQTALQPTKFVLQRRKEIHSAGARRVVIDKSVSEEPVSIEDPTADKRKTSLASSVLPESSCTVSSGDERPCDGLDSKHWVLGTLSDVAYLSTHIKFSRTLKESIIQQDNNESIQGCLKDLTEGIELAAKILNEIPQKDIRQQSKGTSKAERKGNGQGGFGRGKPKHSSTTTSTASVIVTSTEWTSGGDSGDEEQIDGSLCVNGEVPGIEKDGKDEVLINKSLSAGDAVKLTNYILLLLYQRDVAAQFLSRTAPIWKLSQPLCYEYDDSTMNVNVRMGDSEINYGYEYQGSAEHMLITPLTERVLFGVMAAVSSGVDTLCISPQVTTPLTLPPSEESLLDDLIDLIDDTERIEGHGLKIKSTFTPSVNICPPIRLYAEMVMRDIIALPDRKGPYNLTLSEHNAIKEMQSWTDTIIKPSDKGGNVVLWPKNLYLSEAFKQLSDITCYKRLLFDPTQDYLRAYLIIVSDAHDLGLITLRDKRFLTVTNPIIPTFYMLPKVHKNSSNPPGRPIVSGIGSICEKASQFLDSKLRKYVVELPSYVKDTGDILRKIEDLPVEDTTLLVTCDVESLYTSIGHEQGIEAVNFFLSRDHTVTEEYRKFLLRLLKFILNHNYFVFNDRYYLQIRGTAMGAACAPTYANLYLGFWEHEVVFGDQLSDLSTHALIWFRYIDDLLILWDDSEESISQFVSCLNHNQNNLRLTMEKSLSSVNFLDITIFKNNHGYLSTDLYKKPTATNSLLHRTSFHPRSVLEAIPTGEFLRLRRNCSDDRLYETRVVELKNRFKQRGYGSTTIKKAAKRANSTPRHLLISDKNFKVNGTDTRPVRFIGTFNNQWETVRKILNKHLSLLKTDYDLNTILGDQGSGKRSTVQEVCLALGKPLFSFNLTNTTDYSILHDICKGLAASGAWISINGLDLLPQSSLTLLAQLLQQVQSARHYGKETVTLLLEEIPLNPAGACIALINRTPNGIVRWTDSQSCNLPNTLLDCFRILGVSDVPANVILEAKLLLKDFNGNLLEKDLSSVMASRPKPYMMHSLCEKNRHLYYIAKLLGAICFSNVTFLAQKLSDLLDSIAKLYKPTLSASGLSDPGKHLCSSVYGLTNLLDEAGNILQSLQERHKQYQAVEGLANTDEDWQLGNEDKALLIAIRRCWLPQLSADKSRVLKALVAAEWSNTLNSLDILNDNSDIDGPIPTVIAVKYGPGQQVPSSESTDETSVPSAIIKAAEKCHIFPSNTFVSKVSHLVELASKFQTVVVTGPAGCGKTDCIKTYLEVLREQGKKVNQHTVFIKALQPGHLLGFMNEESGWVDGLLPKILRKYCQQHTAADSNQVDILHLDGEVKCHLLPITFTLGLHSAHNLAILQFSGYWQGQTKRGFAAAHKSTLDFFITENNERIRISDSLQLFWEVETLANVSPSVLCCLGILTMTRTDTDWKLPIKTWMKTLTEDQQQLLHQLNETFLEPCLMFLNENHIFPQQGDQRNATPRTYFLSEANVVQTLCRIFKALIQHVPDMMPEDTRKYFIFSCIWSFGTWLDSHERTIFSNWWRRTFRNDYTFPTEGQVWDYHIDTDTRQFVRWHDTLSSYSVSQGQGMASETFVHMLQTEQLLYLSGLLTTSGCPVMLAGDAGCGKTAIIQEIRNSLCTGDVAEMLELQIPINGSTDPRKLWGCLKERLEWRHGTLHTPTGNKKLLCLLDDLNLAKVDKHGNQPVCEFVRQLLDHGRVFDPTSLKLKTISDIIFLVTWNIAAYKSYSIHRLLRHFCLFNCQYPSQNDQFGIFSTILNAHFMQPVTEHKAETMCAATNDCLQGLLSTITAVSIELQERLRTVFLGTSQRCHYIFTLRDLAKIFRNICLSLDGSTTPEKLLLLWKHECEWVYGHKMSSTVDYNRYRVEYAIAAKKGFTNEDELQIILSPHQPLYSNIVEDDGGLITTVAKQQDAHLQRRIEKTNSTIHTLDGYQQTFNLVHMKQLLTEALREYNKVNPRMNITFYENTVHLLCRLTRNLWSPNGSAHTLLCGEGCARSSASLARLAAHLSGFNVVQPGSLNKSEKDEQRANHFKSQLVDCYVKAGLKGQKTLILLTEEEIDNTALVHMAEFVVFGSVAHLFTSEQQATIANALRSEVTNAGLTYSKERSWNLFLQAVQQNVCWFLIYSRTGSTFYKWCLEFSSLINSINIYFIPHWSRKSLVEHASYQLEDLDMFNTQEKENICHLLSSMHLSITKNNTLMQGKYSNITNTTFENFTQCFIALVKTQHETVLKQHEEAMEALGHIAEKMKSHEKLIDELKHQKVVFEEHKEGTLKILYQIAQDKAVVEQKIQIVHQHFQKIQKFQELLPAYQLAHEKAQYKCSAILEYIKELVRHMDVKALGELRAMQKPDVDVEELMASIIIILKSPNTDLTWAKGAKRQMANIDRFLNELLTFSNTMLPQSTLELLETNIKKAQFTPQDMERKAGGNVAAGTLLRWLQGAVRYYRILTSKVKPLQGKVEEMTVALKEAEEKMTALQQKKKELLVRLSDMENSFEEATVHKNKQQQRTMEISQKLEQASTVAELLEEENKKYAAIISSLNDRLSHIPGSTAMAAGLVSYLGAYEHHFRQYMLTVEWPMALKERGFPLMIDSIDPVKGRVIQFSLLLTSDSPIQYQKPEQNEDIGEVDGRMNPRAKFSCMYDSKALVSGNDKGRVSKEEQREIRPSKVSGMARVVSSSLRRSDKPRRKAAFRELVPQSVSYARVRNSKSLEKGVTVVQKRRLSVQQGRNPGQGLAPKQRDYEDGNKNEEMSDWYPDQEETRQNGLPLGEQPSPIITEELYGDYIRALLMRIVKEAELQAWRAEDWTPQQMENAAILSFSWHRPVLLIDPCFEGEKWILEILKSSSGKSFSSINLQTRQDNSVLTPIEKTILSGCPLILNNYSSKWDDLLMPLIDHCNANVDKNNYQDSSSIISFNGHRLLCSDQFKLYLAVSEVESHLNTDIRLGTIIINYSPSKGSVQELLLRRAFAELQPDLHHQLKKLGNVILEHQQHLNQLEEKTRDCFVTPALSNMDNTMTITTLFNEKKEVSKQLKNAKSDYDNLLQARDILYPLALRGARFYFILKSLQCLAAEYYFSLDSFLKLFDSVVGIQVDTQGNTTQMHNQDFQTVSLPVAPLPSDSETDQLQATDKHLCKDSEDTVPAPEGHKLSSTVGAHCFSLSSNQIRKLMDQLTRAVYHSMIQSLLPEHSIQACALLFLCTKELENENAFTEEELAFFAKGSCAFAKTKGELFGSNLNPPSWLPQERWDDLMALSELPAPLKRFCVKVTENSSAWERWYNSDYPDVGNKDDIYNEKASYTIVHFPECGDIEPQITDFHRLLVLRALRPDRFPSALSRYVRGLAGDLALDNLPDDITEIARLEENILGVLVIMPTGTNISSYGGAVMSREHKITICAAAKEKGIPLFTVSMRNGNNDEVKAVINDTINQNGWLVIENLQLASKATLKNLWKSLTYATKMQASQKEERRFCAWLLSETGASIPKNFLAHLKKVSWHVLLMNQMSRKELLRDVTYIDSLPGLLSSAILLALDQIKEEIYEKLRRAPISVRNICFGICVLHGILQTLKLFPRTGLNHLADMGPIQLNQAIDAVLSVYNKTKAGEPFAVAVEEGVNNVYISLTPTLEGAAYIQALVHEIICCCQKDQSFLVTSHLAIPLPPENLDPTEYSSWLISHLPENFSVKELFLPRATEKASSETYASEFMLDLATVYDSMEGVLPLFTPEVNYPAKYLTLLRASIDTVLEQLPPLIQTDKFKTSICEPLFNDSETGRTLQTIDYVLLQECNWMNTYLKKIKHSVSELAKYLLLGLSSTPEHLREAAEALQMDKVPKSWLYPHYSHTAFHNIINWLQDVQKKHKQLKQWDKKGLMPFARGEKGALTSISLGGLFNPEALFLALRVEFSVHHGYLLHEVGLQCHIADYLDYKPDTAGYQLYLERLILQGAAWDFNNNCLKESSNTAHLLPFVIITPAFLGNTNPIDEDTETYDCPVYMDTAMQRPFFLDYESRENTKHKDNEKPASTTCRCASCVLKLPLLCTKPVSQWHLRRVALILSPELNVTSSGKSVACQKKEPQTNFSTLKYYKHFSSDFSD
ncbi:dynein axonemal heavy chain 9-like [Rhinophrynus dorsalis]